MTWKEIEYKNIWPVWNPEISNIEDLQMLSKNIFINLDDSDKIKTLLENFIDNQENKDIKKILAILFIKVYFLIRKNSKSTLDEEFIQIIDKLNNKTELNKENYKNNQLYLNFIDIVVKYLQKIKSASKNISIYTDKVSRSTAWIITPPKSSSLNKEEKKEEKEDINEFDIELLEKYLDRVKSNHEIEVTKSELENEFWKSISFNTLQNFKDKLFDLFIKNKILEIALTKIQKGEKINISSSNDNKIMSLLKEELRKYFKNKRTIWNDSKITFEQMNDSEIIIKNSWIEHFKNSYWLNKIK